MSRKKLIFFASDDPRSNPKPAWTAYHFAEVATKAGLEAEVRLAGDGVKVAHLAGVANSAQGEDLQEKALAGARGAYLVSL